MPSVGLFTSVYVQLIYRLFLCLFWGLLSWQLFRHEEGAEKPDSVQAFDLVPVLLGLALIAARWPTLFLDEPLNPDESWLIAGALALLHDPVPWRGADLTTSGPLNSYILLLPVALGLKISYPTARLVGLSLLIIAVICWYAFAKRIRGKFVAMSVVLPPVTFLCFVQNTDFLHYSTELLPITLLSVAALMASSLSNNSDVRLFVAALFLGMVPFAKLQAAPLAVVAFLAIFFFAWRIHGERFSKTIITMGVGGLIVPLAIGLTLLTTGTLDDAWRSYILSGLQISANPMGLDSFVHYVIGNRAFAYSIGFLALIACTGVNIRFLRDQIRGEGLWLIAGSLVYGLATVYAICKPGNPWGHYLLLGLPAAVFIATAMFAPWHIGSAWQRLWARLRSGVRPLGAMASIMFILMGAVLGTLLLYWHGPPLALERISVQQPDPIARIIHALLKEDSHFAVWGYMPQYYAMTRTRPTTRDVITQFQIWDGPQKLYYRTRYLADFNKSRPNVLVDATGPGNLEFKYSPPIPVEDFTELNEIIGSTYILLLDIRQCNTPRTRIFISRTRLSKLSVETEAIAKASTCLRDNNDLSQLLLLLQ